MIVVAVLLGFAIMAITLRLNGYYRDERFRIEREKERNLHKELYKAHEPVKSPYEVRLSLSKDKKLGYAVFDHSAGHFANSNGVFMWFPDSKSAMIFQTTLEVIGSYPLTYKEYLDVILPEVLNQQKTEEK